MAAVEPCRCDPAAVAEDEAAFEATTHTAMAVPIDLVPAIRELIAKHTRISCLPPAVQPSRPTGRRLKDACARKSWRTRCSLTRARGGLAASPTVVPYIDQNQAVE